MSFELKERGGSEREKIGGSVRSYSGGRVRSQPGTREVLSILGLRVQRAVCVGKVCMWERWHTEVSVCVKVKVYVCACENETLLFRVDMRIYLLDTTQSTGLPTDRAG